MKEDINNINSNKDESADVEFQYNASLDLS